MLGFQGHYCGSLEYSYALINGSPQLQLVMTLKEAKKAIKEWRKK